MLLQRYWMCVSEEKIYFLCSFKPGGDTGDRVLDWKIPELFGQKNRTLRQIERGSGGGLVVSKVVVGPRGQGFNT